MSGFGQGATPVIGYNYGAAKMERVRKAFRLMFTILVAFSVGTVAIIELFPGFFMRLFTSDAELIDMGLSSVRVFMAGMALIGMQSACQQTFMALGQAKISMFLAMLRKIILLLPLALILPKTGLGVWGLLLAEPISDAIASCVTATMFFFKSKKLLYVEGK